MQREKAEKDELLQQEMKRRNSVATLGKLKSKNVKKLTNVIGLGMIQKLGTTIANSNSETQLGGLLRQDSIQSRLKALKEKVEKDESSATSTGSKHPGQRS